MGEEQKPQGKKGETDKRGLLIGILVGLVVLLAIALAVTATPLKEVFFPTQEAPVISLTLTNGPELLEDDSGRYRFEIEAEATGRPAPLVAFNRNDLLDEFAANRTVIILNAGESFTVIATAVNKAGSASASLELITAEEDKEEEDTDSSSGQSNPESPGGGSTPKPQENTPPTISNITLSSDLIKTGMEYTLSVQASDVDGDAMTYEWSATGGTFQNKNANPATWHAPDLAGSCTITVTVSDGRGGQAVATENVTVTFMLIPMNQSVTLSPVIAETGYIVKETSVFMLPTTALGGRIFAGDSPGNKGCRAYMSFDINSLAGANVQSVELRLSEPGSIANPASLNVLWVGVVEYGSRPLELSDYNLSGVGIQNFNNYDITLYSQIGGPNPLLAQELQKKIDKKSGRSPKFGQCTLPLMTNNNSQFDGVDFKKGMMTLKVVYSKGGPPQA
jgi:hypothetical protein